MDLYCGTSGFSYKEWRGAFYPPKLPARDMLAYYATRLPAVEINNSFYRMPRRDALEAWCEQVPEDFRFVIKANRRISHIKRLADCEDEARYLFETVAVLGARLGAVLLQLPPYFRLDRARLDAFLALVPDEIPLACEFRHASWRDDGVLAALGRHDAAWVVADNEAEARAVPATASWTYLRLRAPHYSPEDLRAWRAQCESFERAFVFFKHEDEAAGPALAEQMLELEG